MKHDKTVTELSWIIPWQFILNNNSVITTIQSFQTESDLNNICVFNIASDSYLIVMS